LGADEISALIATGWLREGDETDRARVGAAIAAMLRDLSDASG
jgi:hypothetical protein